VYFPSLVEWALSAGVVAAAGLIFFFIVENFAVFDESWKERLLRKGVFRAAFERWSHVWYAVLMSGLHRVTLIAVFAIPLAWVLLYPPYHNSRPTVTEVQPAAGLDAMRTTLRIDGNRDGVLTDFAHADHQKRLGGEKSCAKCHHISLPQDKSTPCSRCHRDMACATVIFNHPEHTQAVAEKEHLTGWHPCNHSCSVCHVAGQPKTADNAKSCFECHKEDMWPVGRADSTCDLMSAGSFREAMHRTCIPCHHREKLNVDKPHLDECFTCHPSLQPRSVAAAPRSDERFAALLTSYPSRQLHGRRQDGIERWTKWRKPQFYPSGSPLTKRSDKSEELQEAK
ncbi:MAG: cytochrome c3 family protein, partial [Candidatus Zixiibacteriota bacterium]